LLEYDRTRLQFDKHLPVELDDMGNLGRAPKVDLRGAYLDPQPTLSRVQPQTSVVIPAYNEEVAIGSVVLGAKQFSDQVIVIDDGSTDRTAQLAELAGAKVIRLERNSGKANALMCGLNIPENHGCTAIVVMDGDGQHRPEDIFSVIAPVLAGEADLVIGSRFMAKGNHVPAYRRVGQTILNRFTNINSKIKVSDTQSGLRALSPKAIKNLDFASDNYNIESDMIVHFANRGLIIKEVPIAVRYDVPNGHKKNSLTMGMGLMTNVIATIGYKRPLIVFGVPGLILMIGGLFVGFSTMFDIHLFGSWMFQLLTAISLVLMGGFLCVSALTLNSLALLMKASIKSTKS
jgi:glycosyltransferase involved in cell wall biosynthesis